MRLGWEACARRCHAKNKPATTTSSRIATPPITNQTVWPGSVSGGMAAATCTGGAEVGPPDCAVNCPLVGTVSGIGIGGAEAGFGVSAAGGTSRVTAPSLIVAASDAGGFADGAAELVLVLDSAATTGFVSATGAVAWFVGAT